MTNQTPRGSSNKREIIVETTQKKKRKKHLEINIVKGNEKKKSTLNGCQYDITDMLQEVTLESRWFGAYGSSSQSMKMVSQSSFTNPMWTIQEAPFFGSYKIQKCVQPCPQPAQKKHTSEAKPPVTTCLNLTFYSFFVHPSLNTNHEQQQQQFAFNHPQLLLLLLLRTKNSRWNKKQEWVQDQTWKSRKIGTSVSSIFATNDIQATDRNCSIQALPGCRTKTKTPEV